MLPGLFCCLHFSTAILGRSAWAVCSGFIFHFHQLTDLTKYFPDGKYNFLSQMNIQEKKKKKKPSMIYAPMSFACLSHILKNEAGGSASLSECRSLFAGTWYRLTFFDTSYFCQENGVKENVSVNIGFARLLTVHILKFLYAGSGKDLNLMFPRKDRYVLRI